MSHVATHDCIIIGAGLYGLAAANTYLALHPSANLIILESRPCLGGVWSSERGYDDFWTQTPLNMARFSDTAIETPAAEEVYYGFFPASHVTQYLEHYVDSHSYHGRSLRQRITFDMSVNWVSKSSDTGLWIVSTDKLPELSSPRLMVCSGLTSIPKIPQIPGMASFRGKIITQKDFGSSSILSDTKVQHVAVLGGAKFAADIAYAAAKAGKTVSWIIRKSGCGPAAFGPAKGIGPYKNSNELLYNRFVARLTASLWSPQDWTSRWLYQSRVGRWLHGRIWTLIDANSRREAAFESHPNYRALEPDTPMFWANESSGLNQRPDFWATMASEKVRVYREDITAFEDDRIIMSDSTSISPDVVVCAMGWEASYRVFLDEDLQRRLGLPTPLRQCPETSSDTDADADADADPEQSKWSRLEATADRNILERFPCLAHPPPHYQPKPPSPTLSPYRLYKHIAPIPSSTSTSTSGSRSVSGIVFLGHVVVGNNFRVAECQALWAAAYLLSTPTSPSSSSQSPSFQFPHPASQATQEAEVAAGIAWSRRRYLRKGAAAHWLYYDALPYADALLDELGLLGSAQQQQRSAQRRRMGMGWVKWFLGPCVAQDLEGLVDELRDRLR